ncbi:MULTISPECIES: GspH/FimT family pseudopilin [unclassified Variovorax]|jgi:type IV fimbrial biogenesis protein FimT|uniref:GspH/FimT family pseudopilin n=1 Tax=unclassified Variovorax TaxID=663243 RepID=UPI0008C16EB6|nr:MULTISPECIES: GspH/FimT family pseudopilin [unclassified Variovorax]SEK02705.1 type IV fimbrial biogenesis protein FimT [Variovorax sp. OK202]SFD34648.1 type IV fimbrial biogenesis protein FimT [Variovorax sp. OK212]
MKTREGARVEGFTLLELMVVVAIVAVLATVGTPAFRDLLINQRLSAAAQAFNAALSLARMEAIRRSQSVSVTALVGRSWLGGWAVVAAQAESESSEKSDKSDKSENRETLRRFEALPDGISVDASLGDGFAQGVRYDSNGFSRRATSAGFGAGCLTLKAETGRRASIVISASGRARVCNPDQRGDCGTGACGSGGRKNQDG